MSMLEEWGDGLCSSRVSLLCIFRAEQKPLTAAGTELWLFGLMAVVEALPGSC